MEKTPELTKVVMGLTCCTDSSGDSCRVCPYYNDGWYSFNDSATWCINVVRRDAIALLTRLGSELLKKTYPVEEMSEEEYHRKIGGGGANWED